MPPPPGRIHLEVDMSAGTLQWPRLTRPEDTTLLVSLCSTDQWSPPLLMLLPGTSTILNLPHGYTCLGIQAMRSECFMGTDPQCGMLGHRLVDWGLSPATPDSDSPIMELLLPHIPGSLNVSLQKSACRKVLIKWCTTGQRSCGSCDMEYFLYLLSKEGRDRGKSLYMIQAAGDQTELLLPREMLNKGQTYSVQVLAVESKVCEAPGYTCSRQLAYEVRQRGAVFFKTDFTVAELSVLYKKAEDFAHTNHAFFYSCQYMHRNKMLSYYMTVKNGRMEMYAKEANGDPACPAVQQIKGVHFGASPVMPPTQSHFGDWQFVIPVSFMLRLADKLYFSDFFCHYRRHRVSLVMTKTGSEADKVCREKLLPLDLTNNAFLRKDASGQMTVTSGVCLEVFFTEEVSINEALTYGSFFRNICKLGYRYTGRVEGIPKNPECKWCNLKE